jgi:transketolase
MITNMFTKNKKYLISSKIRCNKHRKRILAISQKVTALHAAGAFSALEMVDTIYYKLMKKNSKKKFIDTFLMSKGHGCMSQYVVLESLGIFPKKYLDTYCTKNGKLGCHPDYGVPGIEASTGSLGHGMGLATGMAHADFINKKKTKLFLMISDGELQEGSTWENMMMAANLKLKNLICFIDHNGSQSFGITKETHPKFYPLKEKILSFGWECIEIDGHNILEISSSINKRKTKKPLMIIGNTIKGKGVSFMENKPIWHYRSPNPKEYKIALKELETTDN